MSILIKGMEMPKSCWDCYFQDCGNCRLNVYKVVDKCIIEDRRDEDCPLVPVPPHGRLIDADALWVEINKICDRRDEGIISDLTCLQQLLSAVRHAPTIIPAEKGET